LTSISSKTASITISASARSASKGRRRDQSAACVHSVAIERAAHHARLIRAAYLGEAGVESFAPDVGQPDRNSGTGERHGDAASHRARSDDRGSSDRTSGGLASDARNFSRLPFAEEHMPQRFGLVACDQRQDVAALDGGALLERPCRRSGDAFETGFLGRPIFAGRKALALLLERIAAFGRDREVARAPDGIASGRHLARERDRLRFRVLFDDPIEQGGAREGRRAPGLSGDHRLQRRAHAGEPRQALCAASAGQNANPDLWQCDPRVRPHDPRMAAERQFKSAAHADARNRRDDRFRTPLDRIDHRAQIGLGEARPGVEFTDVGAGRKHAIVPGENDRGDDRIGHGLRERGDNAFAHRVAEAVDRRIVHDEDGDRARAARRDGGRHGQFV
jgi:hypothetical protein